MPRISAASLAEHQERRREQIDGAILALLDASGIDAVTMASVAKGASLSRSSLYEYFGSTTDLRDYALRLRLASPQGPTPGIQEIIDAVHTLVAADKVDAETATAFVAGGLASVMRQ